MPVIVCPNCGEQLDVPPELAGQVVRCGACQSVIEPGIAPPRPIPTVSRRESLDDSRFEDREQPKKRSLTWLWLLLGLGAISCLGCCGGIAFLAHKIENPTWTKFTPPDGRFSVEFPGEPPQIQTRSIPFPKDKPLTLTIYVSERKIAEERYAVGVCELPKIEGPLSKLAAEAYIQACLLALKNQPGAAVTEISLTDITIFGQPGKEFVGRFSDSSIKNGRVTRRLFVLNDRLYMLTALGKDDGPAPAKIERFYSSFEPADAPKK